MQARSDECAWESNCSLQNGVFQLQARCAGDADCLAGAICGSRLGTSDHRGVLAVFELVRVPEPATALGAVTALLALRALSHRCGAL